jgi:hypothetical protein
MQNTTEEYVPLSVYRANLAGLLGLMQQLMAITSALSKALRKQGHLPSGLWTECFDEAMHSELAQAVHRAIKELQGGERSIEDILKDFSGPIQ